LAIGANVKIRLAVSLVSLMLALPCQAKIIYVDDDANGLNDGSSWQNAYKYLQDALMMAAYGDELRVAQGIYKPDQFVLSDRPNLGKAETFQLKNGVTLEGGYAGSGKADPNARHTALYQTILSGDIGIPLDKIDNCYHVFYHPKGLNLDATAILEGFTITGGNANGTYWPHNVGGGMFNWYNSSPNVKDCTFSENSADYLGGGMYNVKISSPNVNNCTFTENSADWGGGMCNYESSPTVTNCTFSGNSAEDYGGGMCNYENSPTVTNCTFSGNSADYGGGMYNYYSSPSVTNCTFSANSADYGGGMYNEYHSSPTVTNCTMADNNAPNGPAVACDYYEQSHPSAVTIHNSIIWNGLNWLWNNDNSTITVTYSDVQGGWPGTGNIDADPCFADPNIGDYHLKSQAGRWDANEGRWTKDEVTSPCIDAGDPASPIGFEPFPNGGIINMGAYGGTEEASKSYFGQPPCETIVAGDINGDCIVNLKDFAIVALHWLEEY